METHPKEIHIHNSQMISSMEETHLRLSTNLILVMIHSHNLIHMLRKIMDNKQMHNHLISRMNHLLEGMLER